MSTGSSMTSHRLPRFAPESYIVIDSLSKRVAPGLSLGLIVPPRRLRESVTASVRSDGWTASGYAFAAAERMMGDGTVAELSRLKRLDARARQKLVTDHLSAFEIQWNEKSLSSVVDAAGALALPDLRRCPGQARHRADALDHLRRHARSCAERRKVGTGSSDNGSARFRPEHTGRDAEWKGARFRYDRMSQLRTQ